MTKPCLHLICNAHLDPVWQWCWQEGCAEAISTFRSAARLLREHPDLIFNHNEALLYQWIKKYDPELFEEIQTLVKEGRWYISGGWYLQPDVNLPGTEAIIRQIQEGRRFFQKYFKTRPVVAYNFDSFGHSGGLPQILVLAGYKMYIHMRPQEENLTLPSDLYCWRGVDGSEILGYRIAVGLYHTEYDNIEQRLIEGKNLALKLNRDVPVFWGIGNHGGGATRKDLAVIDRFIQEEKHVDTIHSTPDRFFHAIKEAAKKAPLVEGSLQRIFTGCYTSLARLKREACKSLHKMIQIEALRTATWWFYGKDYPETDLSKTWHDHLFNDFHDILPGTCIESAEKDAMERFGRVAETLRELELGAAAAFNQGSLSSPPLPLTVMNFNPGLIRFPVEAECMLSHRPKWSGSWYLSLHNPDGTEIICQEEQPEALLPFNSWRRKVVFMAELPSVGASLYQLEVHKGNKKLVSFKPGLNFTFNKKNGFIEKLEIRNEKQLLTGPLMLPLVIDDQADSWGTGCKEYRKVLGKFEVEQDSISMVEKGPIRTIFETVLNYRRSKIIQRIIAYTGWPVLEFRLRILWNEEHNRLKVSIPTIFKSDSVECEILGGMTHKPADGQEHVHGRWIFLKGNFSDNVSALGIVNSGQNGFDFKDGEVRLSLLRSAAFCHEQGFNLNKYPSQKFMDLGVHDLKILITAGDPDEVKQSLPGLAEWLNAPPLAIAHLPRGSFREKKDELSSVEQNDFFIDLISALPQNVRLLACKRSPDKKALIIRLQECINRSTQFTFRIFEPLILIRSNLKPLEIKTYRIEKNGTWAEVDLREE